MSIGVVTQNLCSLCLSSGEHRDHLFFICPFSSFIWSLCRLKLGLAPEASGSLLEEANELQCKFQSKSRTTALARLAFRAAIGHTWKEQEIAEYFKTKLLTKLKAFKGFMKMSFSYCSTAIGLAPLNDSILLNWC